MDHINGPEIMSIPIEGKIFHGEHYVPDVEDIRIGYECEIFRKRDESWWNTKTFYSGGVDWLVEKLKEEKLRVPYLSKEQIQAEGWKFSYEAGDVQHYERGEPWKDAGRHQFLDFRPITKIMKISTTDKGYNVDGPNLSIKYHGKCKDINTFRYICKLLKI